MKKSTKCKIKSLFLLAMFLVSTAPAVFAGGDDKDKGKGKGKGKPPKDISAEFIFEYDTPDAQFVAINYLRL